MKASRVLALHIASAARMAVAHGVMIYREQVTHVAMAMASFSAYDGDQLTKHSGRPQGVISPRS